MTPQEKAQLDYAVKRYKAAENHIETLYLALSAQETPIDTFTPWQSLVNSEPTISEMETVEDGKNWPDRMESINACARSTQDVGICYGPVDLFKSFQRGWDACEHWLKQRMKQK